MSGHDKKNDAVKVINDYIKHVIESNPESFIIAKGGKEYTYPEWQKLCAQEKADMEENKKDDELDELLGVFELNNDK